MLDAAGPQAVREGMLIEGPQGWGEFSPLDGDDDRRVARWLTAAIEPGTVGWPDPVRGRIAVSVSVFTTDAALAHQVTVDAGCRAADVRVAGHPGSLAEDIVRVEAVRDALGPDGAIRCDAGGRWTSTPPSRRSRHWTPRRADSSTSLNPAVPSTSRPPCGAEPTCGSPPTCWIRR